MLVDSYQEIGQPTKRLDQSSLPKVLEQFSYWREAPSRGKSARLYGMWRYLSRILLRFRFAETAESGFYCMVPNAARQDDEIAVFPGAKVPMLLRPVQNENFSNGTCAVIGPVYVHGFMDGQAAAWKKESKLKSSDYVLS